MADPKLTFETQKDGYHAVFFLENEHMNNVRVELTQNWKSLDKPTYTKRILELQAQMIEWHKIEHPDTYVRYAGIEFEVIFNS